MPKRREHGGPLLVDRAADGPRLPVYGMRIRKPRCVFGTRMMTIARSDHSSLYATLIKHTLFFTLGFKPTIIELSIAIILSLSLSVSLSLCLCLSVSVSVSVSVSLSLSFCRLASLFLSVMPLCLIDFSFHINQLKQNNADFMAQYHECKPTYV